MQTKNTEKHGLLSILRPVRLQINIGYCFGALASIFYILNLSIISFILAALSQGQPILIYTYEIEFRNSLILVVIFTLLSTISKFLAFHSSHLGAFKLEKILRINLSEHLAKLPLGFVITKGSGELKKVFLDDVKNLHAFVADSTPLIAKSSTLAVLSLLVLFFIEYKIALAVICMLILGTITMKIAFKNSDELNKKYSDAQIDINKAIIEFVQAMPVVRAFDDGTSSFKRYLKALENFKAVLTLWLSNSSLPARISMIVFTPLPTLLIVFIASYFMLQADLIGFDGFIAGLFLSTGVIDSFLPLMFMSNHIRKSRAAAFTIQNILAEKEISQTNSSKKAQNSSIVFENVSFAYNEKEVLKNINFVAKENTTTAIVGFSGAGKSTIAKLICRFWDIQKGSIKIGEVNIKDMSYDELMQNISFVFQDTFLFNDTILNNIKMAKQNASFEEIKKAAKLAQIDEFIMSLENGYDTKVSEKGLSLSGGQRQRITIARAILRDSPIVILDEATAFSDPENEEQIIKAISNLIKDKTLIIIAHRLISIKNSDLILVLNEGEIAESGTHESLLNEGKIYSNLWQNYILAQNWQIGGQNAN